MNIKAIADDIELSMVWVGGMVVCITKDTATDISPTAGQTMQFTLTPDQAAATMALFVAGDVTHEATNQAIWGIAETAWKDVPRAFRPIP
jgi:hypothetical protein